MRRTLLLASLLCGLIAVAPSAAPTAPQAAGDSPTGVTGIALDNRVELSWLPVSGVTSYRVYRGSSPTTVTTQITSGSGVTGTTYADTTAANGTTYYYAVRSLAGSTESPNSLVVQATPVARSCSTGNVVRLENCYPGNDDWNVGDNIPPAQGGIEGFATKTSINKGESVDLKVSTVQGSPFRIEVFRMGYYGGDDARLFSTIRNVPGVLQPSCYTESTTGLIDCSNWSVSARITTTSSWPSGVYMLRVVRETGGQENHIMVIVRDDSRNSDLLYGVAYTDYLAYNYYGGKSLYDFSSTGNVTVAGTARAVKVSFDRPLEQTHRDRFVIEEVPVVSWLERNGYDVAYVSNNDLDTSGAQVKNHLAYMLQGHDEYWSGGMRTALEQARDAGTSIFSMGGNQVYWKTRFEASPVTGATGRVMVCYKSTQSGGPDPSGIPTGTWRDPAGANKPENALLGNMYVGDNDTQNFPLRVSQAEGQDPFWRYTSVASLAPGASVNIGQELVGWEWDARNANGSEPAGLKVLASSPVSGQLVQNFGRDYAQGSTTTHAVKYTAASGALVIAVGTNFWKRGLGLDGRNEGEPDIRIQQATTNGLADMGLWPTTPAPGITLDSAVGPPTVTARTPAPGASGVLPTAPVTATFSRPMNPSTITSSSFTLRRPDNSIVPATVIFAGASRTATLTPTGPLSLFTTYTARLETTIKAADGQALASPVTWSFTTTATPPPPPTVTNRTPAAGATGVNRDTTVTATFDHTMNASTIDATSFNLRTSGGTLVPASVTFDAATKTATLTPADRLAATTTYTARLETTIKDTDGTALAAAVTWNFTTNASVCPCSLFSPTSFPQTSSLTTNDGHGSPTYELGVKITVDQPTLLEGIRFWKSSTETGTHVGRVWSSTGTPLAQVTFTNEAGSGWQQQLLPTPIELQENTTYVISVGFNAFYGVTPAGLATQVVSGPLRTVVGQNGVYGTAAGTFPTASFNNSNYFVDVRATSAAGTPPTVTSTSPTSGATNVSVFANARATFSRALNPATVTSSSFTLRRPDGTSVPGSVTYDSTSKTATFTPTSQLATSTTYTGRLETSITASDGAPLASVYTWSFTTAASPPAAPTVTAKSPADASTGVDRGTPVTATFSKPMDASTISGTSFTLTGPSGAIAAGVSYDAASQTATLQPTSTLVASTTYTARLDPSIRASDGAPLAAAVTWSFTTSASICPCSLFTPLQQPAQTNHETRDGRGGTGPWTYELGAKVRVDQPMQLTAIRFWKAPLETGTHVGRVWSSTGTQLAQVTFTNETASGWQQQVLPTPLDLQANTTYVVSVGFNAYYSITVSGLATQIDSGPLHSVADGQNGVYNPTAGSFPTSSYNSSNYFVDVRVGAAPPTPPTVTSTIPTAGATGVALTAFARATFSRDMDASTITTSSFTLRRPDNSIVPAAVSYNASTDTATLTPSGALASATTYTARLETTVKAADGTALASPFTWSFTTGAAPAAPTVTGRTPAPGTLGLDRDTSVTATFSRSMDDETITSSSFTLTPQGGSPVPATVTYDAASTTATLVPSALLAGATTYTARLETTIKAADGAALSSAVTWTFATNSSPCPCTLFSSTLAPANTNLATADGHGASTYELGVKIQVTEPMRLGSIRFYKASQETGTHIGRVWTTAGTQLAQVTFTNETASGWQQQALPTPLDLQPNTTYVVSVGFNARYSSTGGGLSTQVVSGPLRSVADGQNGVFGSAAGTFPNSSFNNANYFVDARVTSPPPAVASTTPASGATGVATSTTVQATFTRPMQASTITSSSFTLTGPSGAVPASVAYNATNQTATLTPSAALTNSATYTARLETTIMSADAIPMASVTTWSFTTGAQILPPTVTGTSPAAGATGVSRDTAVTATFSRAMNAATITGSTFTLTGPGGAVAATVTYDSGSLTATLTPTAQLAASTSYTARLETGITSADGAALASAVTWSFTTTGSLCPCSLFTLAQTPASTGNSTQDGRGGTGPWTYELGVKIQVTQAMNLTSIEFYKSPGETGTHVGRVWAVGGAQLAQVTFTGETASGWQQATLSAPLALQPNTTYIVSVNANARYVLTAGGLSTQITNGPLRSVADGQNGVYGLSAGTFPSSSWNSSNYFIDTVVQ